MFFKILTSSQRFTFSTTVVCKSDAYLLCALSSFAVRPSLHHCLHITHTTFFCTVCLRLSLLLFPFESSYSNYYVGGDRREGDNDNGGDNGDAGFYYGKSVCAVADGGESDQWYLGQTQCFKANSAFSLYGILKESPAGQQKGSYCHKGTFINSFFTTAGVETIAQTFGLGSYVDGVPDDDEAQDNEDQDGFSIPSLPSSYCTWTAPYSDDDGGQEGAEEDRLSEYTDATSYGTGCLNKKFVLDQFEGALCNPARYQQTLDTFDTFNGAVEDMGCFQIYDGSNNRKLEDEENAYVLYPLSQSRACSVQLYPEECPDPYGLVKKYEHALDNALATKTVTMTLNPSNQKAMFAFSWIFLIAGLAMMIGSFFVHKRSSNRTIKDDSQDMELESPPSFVKQVSTVISEKSRSFVEKIQSFAEAEEDVLAPDSPPRAVEEDAAPTAPVDEPYVQITSASGEAPASQAATQRSPVAPSPTKKKKRPRMAKLSKRLFGSSKKQPAC